jgi:hypothetical protein
MSKWNSSECITAYYVDDNYEDFFLNMPTSYFSQNYPYFTILKDYFNDKTNQCILEFLGGLWRRKPTYIITQILLTIPLKNNNNNNNQVLYLCTTIPYWASLQT